MNILTKKSGIALVAVLTVLLVLTLLLPVMFTMADRAMVSASKGQNEQRASYLARTSVEMTVSAFQDFYDAYDEKKAEYKTAVANGTNMVYPDVCVKYDTFTTNGSMDADKIYMYTKDGVEIPSVEDVEAWDTYQSEAVIYKTKNEIIAGYTLLGFAECDITYDEISDYYRIDNGSLTQLTDDYQKDANGNFVLDANGNKIPIEGQRAEDKYNTIKTNLDTAIRNGVDTTNYPQCHKVDRKEIRFDAVATIGEKTYRDFSRGCLVILPTKPSDESWIVPAAIESNQIFVDSEQATGVMTLDYADIFMGTESDTKATSQVVYSFSCAGNMVITNKGMTIKDGNNYVDYNTYIKNHPEYTNQLSDFSLGVHPITHTINPENDPNFSCLKTNNMRTWASGAQKDNFIMFSATNGIQVDMPVNLMINPCRTMRIGDGISRNQSLYKVLAFQSPNIIFKGSVNNFVSLWKKTSLLEGILDLFGDGYDARRVSSIILAAPENTPYSYVNGDRDEIVKAGKVFFGEDAYVWLIPFSENGSGYKTQTVYYKNSDIKLYKMANKGDVYYFNSEVPTKNGAQTTGFSMTGYFMDVLYNDMVDDSDYGWRLWSQLKDNAFGFAQSTFMPQDYVKDDFHYVGNIYEGTGGRLPIVDDFYVVWDS